jgi:hypothetical protein
MNPWFHYNLETTKKRIAQNSIEIKNICRTDRKNIFL